MAHAVATPLTGSQLTRGRWLFAFSLVTSLFFTWGFAYELLDVLNAHVRAILQINTTQSSLLRLTYLGAYVVWSPFAGVIMRRYGYKAGIHLGLALYSLGAIFFWPSAKFAKYGGFVGCTFVIGCGLATLEVAANSYIAVLGTPKYAAARLNFSQGLQGVVSFAGPPITSRWFFRGANATKLGTVQWVYLAVAGFGVVLNILFYFCDLPEIEEEATLDQVRNQDGQNVIKAEPFMKQYRCIFGFVAQTTYVGAQVGVATFAINFMVEQGIDIHHSRASKLFSYCQKTFTAGRLIGVAILNFIDPALLLSIYAVACVTLTLAVVFATSQAGIGCLFGLFFFESICYACIFTLATKNLGIHTKQGSGLIVMGIGGSAWYPSLQGALASRSFTRRSYLVPLTGYITMAIYAFGIVINQAKQEGFRVRNIHESNHRVHSSHESITESGEKGSSSEHVENSDIKRA